MAHAVWKGTLEFGLVTIPIGLYPAESSEDLDLRMLDSEDLSPVGYNLINKSTGESIPRSRVVKGYEYEEGRYVTLTDEELKSANAEATQTVDIVGFVDVEEIPPSYFDRPYWLAPEKKGQKAYVLFREALLKARKIGVARVVLRTRQHMAAVYPQGDILVLQLLRYASEFRDTKSLDIPDKAPRGHDVSPREVAMAIELIGQMAEPWKPAAYHDEYHDQLLEYIESKAKTGKGKTIPAARASTGGGKVLDLMSLLKKSVEQGKRGSSPRTATATRSESSRAGGARSASSRRKAPAPLKLRATKKPAPKRRSA
ncbi:MAG TPA: Ku protein [Candidatus Eisenbacteria bacterium]